MCIVSILLSTGKLVDLLGKAAFRLVFHLLLVHLGEVRHGIVHVVVFKLGEHGLLLMFLALVVAS